MKKPNLVYPPELDAITAISLNARFNGFLQMLCEQLDLDYPSVAAISRDILEKADITQDEISMTKPTI